MEACGFRDLYADFREAGVEVLGVSSDPVKKLANWAKKKDFPYPLLGDEDHGTLAAWGVWGKKKFMGREFMGVARASFLVDEGGNVVRAWPKVKPADHPAEVLAAVREMPAT